MATWPGTKTVVHGPALVSDWNTFVRDAFLFLYNLPRVRAYNSAAISIAHDTETVVTYNSERYDSDSMHSTSTNPGRLTAVTEGLYSVTFCGAFPSNATGFRQVKIRKNGTISLGLQTVPAVSGNFTWFSATTHVELAVGDYVEALAYQNSGGALEILASAQASPEFMAHWVAGL